MVGRFLRINAQGLLLPKYCGALTANSVNAPSLRSYLFDDHFRVRAAATVSSRTTRIPSLCSRSGNGLRFPTFAGSCIEAGHSGSGKDRQGAVMGIEVCPSRA